MLHRSLHRRITPRLLTVLTILAMVTGLVNPLLPVSTAAAATAVTVSGTVTSDQAVPVPGTTIAAQDPATHTTVASAVTDTNGAYSLSVATGTYDFQATPPSSTNFVASITQGKAITADTTLNFILVPKQTMVSVSGTLRNPAGDGLPGQSMKFEGPNGNAYPVTDATGHYSVTLPPGTYRVRIEANDNDPSVHASATYYYTVDSLDASSSRTLDFTLPFRRVDLTVKDVNENPLAGATISVPSIVSGYLVDDQHQHRAITDTAGHVTLWLLDGPTQIQVIPPAGVPGVGAATPYITGDTQLTINLINTVTISGRFTNALGEGLPGVPIRFNGAYGEAPGSATTDADGMYSVQLAAGTYNVNVWTNTTPASAHAPQQWSFGAGSYTFKESRTLDFAMPIHRVDVHVQDSNGQPLANAGLTTFFWQNKIGASYLPSTVGASTYANGDSNITTPVKTDAAGNATMWLTARPDQDPYTISVQASGAVGSNFTTRATADEAVTVTVQPPVTLRGTVKNSLGEPLPNQNVHVWGPNGAAMATVSPNGDYTVQVSPGDWGIEVYGGGNNTLHLPNHYDIRAAYATVSADRVLDLAIPVQKVTVRVQDPAGNPVPDVTLYANDQGSLPMPLQNFGVTLFAWDQQQVPYWPQDLTKTDANGQITLWLEPVTTGSGYNLMANAPSTLPFLPFSVSNLLVPSDLDLVFVLQFSHDAPVTTAAVSGQQDAQGLYLGQATVTLTAAAASGYTLAGTYYRIDNGPVQTYTAPFNVTGSGKHQVSYWSKDTTGVTEVHKSLSLEMVTPDTTPPTVALAVDPAANAAGWRNTDVTVTWAVADAESGIAATTGCDAVTLTADTAGQTITCQATNGAGLAASGSVTVKLDKTAPVTTATVSGSKVTLAAADSLSGVTATYFSVDGGAVQTGTTVTVTGTGTHTVAYWSEDAAGNAEQQQTVDVTVAAGDTTPPVTTATAPTGWTPIHDFPYTATDDLSGVKATYYTLGDGANHVTHDTFSVPHSGEWDITYWSVDNAGNVEDPHTMHVMVDAEGPHLNATGSLDENGHVIVTMDGWDELSGLDRIEYSLDGGQTYKLYTGPFQLEDGFSGKLFYRGFDKAGNVTTCEVEVSVITGGDWTGNGTYRVCGITDPNSTFTIYVLDPATGETFQVTVVADANGNYCVEIPIPHDCTCKLHVGGTIPAPEETIIIDGYPPVTGVELPDCVKHNWCGGGGGVPLILKPTDGGSGVVTTEISTDGGGTWIPYPPGGYTVTGDGIHEILARSTDGGGHTEEPIHITIPIDGTGPGVTWTWDPGSDTITFTGTDSGSGVDDDGVIWWEDQDDHCGCRIIIFRCRDRAGNPTEGKIYKPVLHPPVAEQFSYEGETKQFDLGSIGDITADGPWNVTVNWGDGSPVETFQSSSLTLGLHPHRYLDNGVYSVHLQVVNGQSIGGFGTVKITVYNLKPEITDITGPVDPQLIGTTVPLTATFTDPGILDWHTATIDWGDGSALETVPVTEAPGPLGTGTGTLTGSHPYLSTGVYTVTVTVTDKDGASDVEYYRYVVIYDPNGGFVTGGGWINSPAGAYTANSQLTGRANFGLVSKYLPGANVPSGQTEFQFKVGNFNFHSTSYDWLVVSGAKAQYKGYGTVNGAGNYQFIITVIDGQINGGGGVDKFRIKIWNANTNNVVYDNQIGAADTDDPTTALANGSIVIHKEN